MRKLIVIPWLCALVALAGCETLGFTDKKKEVKPKPVASVGAGMPARPLWQMDIGSTGKLAHIRPALVGDQIIAASESGTVIAVTTDGRSLWQVSAGFKVMAGVDADTEMAVVGGSKGALAAFDTKTGTTLWKTSISAEVSSPPLITSDVVVVRALDGRIFGLNRADGSRKWVYQRIMPSLILRQTAPMTLAQNYIFVGYPGGKLVVLEQERGTLVFEENVSVPKGDNELERLTDIASRPVVYEQQVCVGAYQGRVGCFSLKGGDAMWFKNISSTGGVDVANDEVFVIGDDGFLYALDKDFGTEKWKTEVLPGDRSLQPVAFKETVTVADSLGYLHFFSATDGKPAGRMTVDGSALAAAPILIPEKGILVQTTRGRLSLLVP